MVWLIRKQYVIESLSVCNACCGEGGDAVTYHVVVLAFVFCLCLCTLLPVDYHVNSISVMLQCV